MSTALVKRDPELQITWADRFWLSVAPAYGQRRIEARARAQMMTRHFEAAQGGRRTDGWRRSASDANVANRPALAALREHSRDLRRNNGWAKRGIQAIVNNTVGWGIMPKAKPHRSGARSADALQLFNDWADSTSCDYDGRLNFYGLQRLVMETVAESGECLIVRQPAAAVDGLPIPMRLHVIEPDYLDLSRNGMTGPDGGPTYQGVEFDKYGRRTAYWLFTEHPGGLRLQSMQFYSVRVPADRVLHVYRVDRPGQIRGVPWLASAISRLKDYDDFEDAELMQQKVAACFGAFVSDMDGTATPLGQSGTDSKGNAIESLEPGHIEYLAPGKTVTFASPPAPQGGSLSQRTLRRIAASIGVTYEELTGDYGGVNFSSARMARIAEWQNVCEWREHMIIPQLCNGVWAWAMQLAAAMNNWPAVPGATWSAPPMPMLEPDKEGLAYQRLIRNGLMTYPQVVRELGYDPAEQIAEIAETNKALDDAGIVLDFDPRQMTQAGQVQAAPSEDDVSADDAATATDATDGTDATDSTATH